MSGSRVSTATVFSQSTTQILRQQSQVARAQLELSSGRKIITAKDDPVAAGIAETLDRSLAEINRWGANANLATNRLQREEEAIRQVGLRVQRLRELAVQSNNGIQSPQSLSGLVVEMRQIREDLVQLANTSDGLGRYLFGGTLDGSPPFVKDAAGAVTYVGDQNQRFIEIGPETLVADGDPGSEVFQRIKSGDGTITLGQGANTGTAYFTSSGFIDRSQWDGGSYQIDFLNGDYTITDTINNVAIATGTYVEGEAITFRGVQLTFAGTPADGDSFTVVPSPARDIFTVVDSLIATVEAPTNDQNERSIRQNQFYFAFQDLQQVGDWVSDRRAAIGSRLNTLERSADQRLAEDEGLRKSLSELRDTNFAEAISRLAYQLQTLEAAQKSFTQVQRLSLFNYL
ncbi:MAG TPA: flagellar hook-associated protein FlgL [Vicinamibacterales bacterium]|nr:flagellar hook-associated protein FlgL [Vicinamibacterales bacterium]